MLDQDGRGRTDRTGKPGQDSRDRTAGEDIQDMRSGLKGQENPR